MKKNILFLLILLTGCTHSTVSTERNPSGAIKDMWTDTGGDKDSLIRSNPQHFWAWMKQNAPKKLGTLVNFTGEVSGDPHFYNFADIHVGPNQNGLALVDVDDSGKAPMILDFVRYYVFVKATTKTNYLEEMYAMYLKGLEKDRVPTPDVLKEAIQHTRTELLAEHKSWVDRNLDAEFNLDNGKNELTGFKSVKPEIKALGKKVQAALLSQKKVDEIFDAGHTSRESGSSKDMNRFWFSAKLDNRKTIIECKELGKPSVGEYQLQNDHKKRVEDVLKYYSDYPSKDTYVLAFGNNDYWCRPRHFDFLNRDSIKTLGVSKTKELSLYFAYWLGARQSLQAKGDGLLKALKTDTTNINKIEELLKDYNKVVNELRK